MVAILHEGKTDRAFFDNILKAYRLPNDEENVKYYDFGGVDNIFKVGYKHYDTLEEEIRVGKISKALIVADADNNYDERESNLKTLIDDLDFNIEIDYFIMSGKNHTGNLESFLLSSLDDEQKKCLKTFLDCYAHEFSDKHIYNIFYKDKRHPFDFNTPVFNDLKSKLEKLLSGD